MRLILNGVNGGYIRNILVFAPDEVERVDAIVAYATDSSLLFDWCVEKGIPLRFWGRFDEGVPVALSVLKKFLDLGSASYRCNLLRHLHAKVIWWRGYGVYIGSANLTQSAWWKNLEAGCFLTDEEIVNGGHASDLEELFRQCDGQSSPLTSELYTALEARQTTLNAIHVRDRDDASRLVRSPYIHAWDGLDAVPASVSLDRRKAAFLREWVDTLQTMRDIAQQVGSDRFRPDWIRADVPEGAQADQFLHAHYYQRTFDGRRASYESYYERNRPNPQRALAEAMTWWHQLSGPPTSEAITLNEWAPFLKQWLSRDALHRIRESDLKEIFLRVHAIRDHARRVANAEVGLPGDAGQYSIEQKVVALTGFIWRQRTPEGRTIVDVIDNVLYGGRKDEVPERLWAATNAAEQRMPHIGVSALGELVGWADPDSFPPRNGRTSKALRSLGFDVAVHVG